jgi:hypothetical protein
MLGRKWTVAKENNGLTVIIGNNVSYSPYVHDPEKQAAFHKARGWKTTEQVANEETDVVMRQLEAALIKDLGG